MNVVEYFIHHEDVRRAEPGWEPRDEASLDAALWTMIKRSARVMARRMDGAGLELVADGYGTVVARTAQPRAAVSGGPQELMLLLFGRIKAARVEVEGPAVAQDALAAARMGI